MSKHFDQIIVLVLDGFGIGELADAKKFGDIGSNTLESLLKEKPSLQVPNLTKLGLFNAAHLTEKYSQLKSDSFSGLYSRMNEVSAGKDTTTGHWEMMGLPLSKPFDFFSNGFSDEILNDVISKNHLPGVLGNKAASGTDILDELGEEHIASGKPIVYTSADSVFQIAAHEKHFGLQKLYDLCVSVRAYFNKSDFVLGRVIARPFLGEKAGEFKRTVNRHDYSIKPYGDTTLSELKKAGLSVIGFGKIPSIYDHIGLTEEITTGHDDTGFQKTFELLETRKDTKGLFFVNLNDLDTLYGHRRKPLGYAEHLEQIDIQLGQLLSRLTDNQLLMVVSDHGNDPAFAGTDHTREYVPLLLHSSRFKKMDSVTAHLEDRASFSDVGASILDNFDLPKPKFGTSLFTELKKKGVLS